MNKIELRQYIKAALMLKGMTGSKLARELGIGNWNVYAVINGERRTKRIRDAIEKIIEEKIDWDVYDQGVRAWVRQS